MKKKIIYSILSILILVTGCAKHSNQGIGIQTGQYIFFDADIALTKGGAILGETLPADAGTAFGVFGYRADGLPIFDLYTTSADAPLTSPVDYLAKVYRPSASAAFTYDGLSIWKTGVHTFHAYYPYDSEVVMGEEDGDDDLYISYTQPEVLTDMVDYMTAYKSQSLTDGSNVELSFYHRLWALSLDVEFDQTSHPIDPESDPSLTIVSAELQLKNIPETGLLAINQARSFNAGGDYMDLEYDLSPSTPITLPYTVGENTITSHSFGPMLFFPTDAVIDENTKLQYRLELTFINSWGKEFSVSYPSEDESYADFAPDATLEANSAFEAGKHYKLKVTKSQGESITVNFAFEDDGWEEKDIYHTFN